MVAYAFTGWVEGFGSALAPFFAIGFYIIFAVSAIFGILSGAIIVSAIESYKKYKRFSFAVIFPLVIILLSSFILLMPQQAQQLFARIGIVFSLFGIFGWVVMFVLLTMMPILFPSYMVVLVIYLLVYFVKRRKKNTLSRKKA